MKELTQDELANVNGGLKIGTITLFSLGAAFVIGIIDGFFRPLKCR